MSQELLSDETNRPSPYGTFCTLTSDIILKNARYSLRHSGYPELWNITCDFCEGMLTLQGVVGSYFLKQLAHTAVLGVAGVEEVANRLKVQYPANPQNGRG
jgi:osmotically-inducible protein OsmY